MKQTKTNNNYKIFFILFIITLIPTVYVYLDHGSEEYNAYNKSIVKGNEIKATKQLGEALLFNSIGVGYIIGILFILRFPESKIPYLVLIVGTISVIILWLVRIYGIPVIGTEIVITDFSSDWRDVVTKTGQTIILVLLTAMLFNNRSSNTTRISQQDP